MTGSRKKTKAKPRSKNLLRTTFVGQNVEIIGSFIRAQTPSSIEITAPIVGVVIEIDEKYVYLSTIDENIDTVIKHEDIKLMSLFKEESIFDSLLNDMKIDKDKAN